MGTALALGGGLFCLLQVEFVMNLMRTPFEQFPLFQWSLILSTVIFPPLFIGSLVVFAVLLIVLASVLYLALNFVFFGMESALTTMEKLCEALDVEERRRRA